MTNQSTHISIITGAIILIYDTECKAKEESYIIVPGVKFNHNIDKLENMRLAFSSLTL